MSDSNSSWFYNPSLKLKQPNLSDVLCLVHSGTGGVGGRFRSGYRQPSFSWVPPVNEWSCSSSRCRQSFTVWQRLQLLERFSPAFRGDSTHIQRLTLRFIHVHVALTAVRPNRNQSNSHLWLYKTQPWLNWFPFLLRYDIMSIYLDSQLTTDMHLIELLWDRDPTVVCPFLCVGKLTWQ